MVMRSGRGNFWEVTLLEFLGRSRESEKDIRWALFTVRSRQGSVPTVPMPPRARYICPSLSPASKRQKSSAGSLISIEDVE
jgi:hypothetical protein